MSGIVDRLLSLPGWIVLLVTGLVVFCEDALFVGFVLPGETVALLAGAAAKLGHASLWAVLVWGTVVVLAGYVAGTPYAGAAEPGAVFRQATAMTSRRNSDGNGLGTLLIPPARPKRHRHPLGTAARVGDI
jgi:hypothetical protein